MLVHYVTCLCEESLSVYIRVNKIDVKIVGALVLLLQQRVDMLECLLMFGLCLYHLDRVCLLRGTSWVFTYKLVNLSP